MPLSLPLVPVGVGRGRKTDRSTLVLKRQQARIPNGGGPRRPIKNDPLAEAMFGVRTLIVGLSRAFVWSTEYQDRGGETHDDAIGRTKPNAPLKSPEWNGRRMSGSLKGLARDACSWRWAKCLSVWTLR